MNESNLDGEIQRLRAEMGQLSAKLHSSAAAMPQPPFTNRRKRREFEQWLAKREKLLERHRGVNRRLANLRLPLHPRPETEPPTLFDSHLLLPFEFVPTYEQLKVRFWDNPRESGRLLRNLLLYDRIFIPTVDLLVLIFLLGVIGIDNLLDALESEAITFVRYRGALSYIGGGNGLGMFELRSNQEGRIQTHEDRSWAPTEEVLRTLGVQYASGDSPLAAVWGEVTRRVLDHIVEIDPLEFDAVADATYHDVAGNPGIQALFELTAGNLKSLPGSGLDSLRWLGANRVNDDVDRLLHLAQFNFETYSADKVGALDQTSGPGAQPLLAARAASKAGAGRSSYGFDRILKLNRVPDFSALHDDDTGVDRLFRLRRTKEAVEFRKWFHQNVRDKPDEAEALFFDTLAKPTLGTNPIVRALRYIASNGIPLVAAVVPELTAASPAIGLATSAADSFLVDRFLRPNGPKIMIDRLRGILPAPELPEQEDD